MGLRHIKLATTLLLSLLITCYVASTTLSYPAFNTILTRQDTNISTIEVQAILFNTSKRIYVGDVKVSFYNNSGLVREVITSSVPQLISLEEGRYLVIANYRNSELSEEFYIKAGFGRIYVEVDPENYKLLYIEYIFLRGPIEKASIEAYSKYFNSTNTSYLPGITITFYSNGSKAEELTTKDERESIQLEFDKTYYVVVSYKGYVKNTTLYIDSRFKAEKYILIVYINKEENSILHIGFFRKEPYIYGEKYEINVLVEYLGAENPYMGVNVKFYKFYKNNSVLLYAVTKDVKDFQQFNMEKGYYLTKIETNNDSYEKILEFILGDQSTLHVKVNATTGEIIDVKVYIMLIDGSSTNYLLIILLISVIIPLSLTAIFIKKRREGQ